MTERLLPERDDGEICSGIQSILLVAASPVSVRSLALALGMSHSAVEAALDRLQKVTTGGIRLQMLDDCVQLVTAPENAAYVQRFLGVERPALLSRSALETLVVIAYRQPVTRAEIEEQRGVNSDRTVQTLMTRGLIEERGHRQTLGRPMEYGTAFGFLEYFGLSSLDDLPALPEKTLSQREPQDLGFRP